MPMELRVVAGIGGYEVIGPGGTRLNVQSSRQAAIGWAIAHLHAGDGGQMVVVERDGTAGTPTPVEGRLRRTGCAGSGCEQRRRHRQRVHQPRLRPSREGR